MRRFDSFDDRLGSANWIATLLARAIAYVFANCTCCFGLVINVQITFLHGDANLGSGLQIGKLIIRAIAGDRGTPGQNVMVHFAFGTLRSELVSVYAHDIAFLRFGFCVFHNDFPVWWKTTVHRSRSATAFQTSFSPH